MAISKQIQEFFTHFDATNNNFDATQSAGQFSDVFLHADPQGVQAVPKAAFIGSLDRRKAYFDSLGLRQSELAVTDELKLNDAYTLVKVAVKMYFGDTPASQRVVGQTATYILKMNGPAPVIVFYLNDQTLTELLQANGILKG